MSDPNQLPVAGWYPDPEDERGDRWWNGATWSDHRRPRNAAPGWAPASAQEAAPASTPAQPVPPVPVPPVVAPPAAPYAGAPAAQPGQPAQPGPYVPYAPAYAPNYAPASQPMRNPTAFGAMLTSLIGLLFNWILWGAPGLVGAILGIIGLRKATQLRREGVTTGDGRAMAITAIVAGFAGAFLFDLFYFTVISPFRFS